MDNYLVNISGSIISGAFAIIAAFIPHYLEKRKSRVRVLEEIERGEYQEHSMWHFLFGISIPLVFFFLYGLYAVFYGVAGMFMVIEQLPNSDTFFDTYDLTNSTDTLQFTGIGEIFLQAPVLFLVFLLVAKYLGHRCGHKAPRYISISIVVLLLSEISLAVSFPALEYIQIIHAVSSIIIYSTAAAIGISWARRTQDSFVISQVYTRLSQPDRDAFRDLAQSLIVSSRKR